ncbi:type II toxin-antitoxin system RelE/ParE family toxin [Leptolyngbya sp. NIES-2104]|uniref:type II toxin-antitoxin system RelE/ParE family toxin n=1 Tax=Leptolyngbya sp. NIES-2104 TaxID=1552121 RepID=UPI0006EC581C|nr:type II toxin-antitoxin system RelE/ParE family toxin [Leptolyngbya sp. NIES-2104]GAP94081.1 hypothetical protein NIES2104_05910 [Leptolyngbya sp. NIES-2104]
MSRGISIRPAASNDIDQHVSYLAENDPSAAMRFFDAARQTFANLARTPGIGKIYRAGEDETQNIRRWAVKGFKSHLIFYRFDHEVVEIIRVLHGAQDIERILEDSD